MRHGKKINHLGRKSEHRKAMLANMASSLILHKRITTTVAKAKALRKYVEPLITKSKDDTTHSRRTIFSYLKQKEAVKELFDIVSVKVAERPGGYTRIIKTGTRLGDNAETCVMELVDFNELYTKDTKKKSTRRRRRSTSSAPKVEKVSEEVAVAEEVVEDEKVENEAVVDETQAEENAPEVKDDAEVEQKDDAPAQEEDQEKE